MPPKRKRKKRQPAAVRGLTFRNGVAYWRREHARLPNGLVVKSLQTSDPELGADRAGAVNTLMDRGDWKIIERWVAGEIDITDIAKAVRDGEYAPIRRVSIDGTRLGDAVETFLQNSRGRKLAPASLQQYESILGHAIDEWKADYPMALLLTAEAQAFLYRDREGDPKEPWAPRTQRSVKTVMATLWDMVIETEKEHAELTGATPAVTTNPWRKCKTARRRQTRHAFLSKLEWAHVSQHPDVAGTPTLTMLALATLAGLRRAEIQNLRTDIDVRLDLGYILIQDREGEFAWTTKTENSLRKVPIYLPLRRILEDHIRRGYAGARFCLHTAGHDTPIGDDTTRSWTKAAFEAAGIKYGRKGDALTLHSCRHTYATWAIAGGVPIPTVAKYMGDTNETILSTYAHHMPDDEGKMQTVIEQMGEAA